jgi:hypothetical protein
VIGAGIRAIKQAGKRFWRVWKRGQVDLQSGQQPGASKAGSGFEQRAVSKATGEKTLVHVHTLPEAQHVL